MHAKKIQKEGNFKQKSNLTAVYQNDTTNRVTISDTNPIDLVVSVCGQAKQRRQNAPQTSQPPFLVPPTSSQIPQNGTPVNSLGAHDFRPAV